MNESNSLINAQRQKIGLYLKKNKKRNIIIKTKLAFNKIKEKSKINYIIVLLIFILIVLTSIFIILFLKKDKKSILLHLKRKIDEQNIIKSSKFCFVYNIF